MAPSKPGRKKDKLNDMELRFIKEYMKDANATQAAGRAGYSVRSADTQGCRLLKKDRVRREVDRLMAKSLESSTMTKERMMKELEIMATYDYSDFAKIVVVEGEDGTNAKAVEFTPTDQLPLHQSRAIQGMSSSTTTTRRGAVVVTTHKIDLNLHDKAKAGLAWLKAAGHIKDKVELSGDKESPVQVKFYVPGNGRDN